ncbi:hypothetical protein BDF20DRAFT_831477 [Mycotypha africana]|uniref:uncharacterized protein n=1 Tax=Mycotypha africana TaxID=64632 RepID=UPI002301F717|nr:uncharacterized protein BDF20DRAFT_831477 [Mycotypha africana]KAI8991440.1 hypothetical protein BDF20DRAFT_831477 [Mycotypha africana]
MLPNDYKPLSVRPMSEVLNPGHFMNEAADIAGNWYEDLQNYERNLDEMASATLDQNFKEEMQHVDQWYRYLTEAEKTATMYTLLQHSSQVQVRFFINVLQQMVKRDPLHSLLTPSNPEQDMQTHLAGAMAKAELEASQRLMSVLPFKTGQVISRPPSTTSRRTVERHSFALGDTEEYSHLFGRNNASDFLTLPGAAAGSGNTNRSSFVGSILDETPTLTAQGSSDSRRTSLNTTTNNSLGSMPTTATSRTSGRSMFNSRPRSVIEGDTNSLFPTWNSTGGLGNSGSSNISSSGNNNNLTLSNAGHRRQPSAVGPIGSNSNRMIPERPKSADISNWSLPSATTSTESLVDRNSIWGQPPTSASSSQIDNELIDFTNPLQQPFRNSRSGVVGPGRATMNRIPAVPESDEFLTNSGRMSFDLGIDTTTSMSSTRSTTTSPFRKPTGLERYATYLMQTSPPSSTSINTTPTTTANSSASAQNNDISVQSIVDNTNKLTLYDNDYPSDQSDQSHMSPHRRPSSVLNYHGSNNYNPSGHLNSNTNNHHLNTRAVKDKKAVEIVDMELLKDIPAWLRSLRLHKYNPIFADCKWQEMIKMTDEDLLKRGVAALGARRKMLKVFDNIKAHCQANNIDY